PPMHRVVVTTALLAEHPWLAASVYDGLRRMLDAYVERQRATGAESPVWPGVPLAEQEALMGPQPWPSGVAANRPTLEAWIGYALEQGVIAERLAPGALVQDAGRAPARAGLRAWPYGGGA